MSDLKHMTPAELRKEIAGISNWRAKKEAEAKALEARAASLRQSADEEDRAAGELRRRAHNMGQREAWARTYLAQKEVANAR